MNEGISTLCKVMYKVSVIGKPFTFSYYKNFGDDMDNTAL